ncbi:hypothetical protein [Pseudomonas japonica]|uniref:Uncharacterized protein n=1 Tax=Pseudomonas japonica TaxID=256466 RepID=A0A239BWV2_9PSED|nr:hypothetical protein [Pseudomonas japonica]SNS12497.1 hypothetical protein SAMN05444352_103251 [Pseudomonas japonica]
MGWPRGEPYARSFHERFPSRDAFWVRRPDKDQLPQVAEPAPLEWFLKAMRGGAGDPKIRVR